MPFCLAFSGFIRTGSRYFAEGYKRATTIKLFASINNEWELKKNKHRVIDIVDHSVDMLLLKDTSRIEVLADGEMSAVEVDFELYATGVKNLIDNALKYSSDKVVVTIDKSALCISSVGDELEPERLEFDRAFNRRVETSNSGLGLGLYIANQIFKKHGHTLKYKHEDGKNNFMICFV